LTPKSRKEVWFEEGTILSLIAGCIEVIEGGSAENDTEMVGLTVWETVQNRAGFAAKPLLRQTRIYSPEREARRSIRQLQQPNEK
jgi:hypothetical protein